MKFRRQVAEMREKNQTNALLNIFTEVEYVELEYEPSFSARILLKMTLLGREAGLGHEKP